MYEENVQPLPSGDISSVFADVLAAVAEQFGNAPVELVAPETVVQWAHRNVQPWFGRICRRLLLPGSGVRGTDRLGELLDLARAGKSCIVCLNHRSNLDVPTLQVLLQDQGRPELFDRIVWVAGRKLQEDEGPARTMLQGFHRVLVTPKSWIEGPHSEDANREARRLNMAAHRAMRQLRHQGWVFGLFPAGTRVRLGNKSTARAIEETDSYLKNFEYLLLGHIEGCTLPVTRDRDFAHETPKLDRIVYRFGPVHDTQQWRAEASRRFENLSQRAASAEAIMADIEALPSTI